MKLEEIFKTLGIPLAAIAVIVALLAWAGLTLDQLYAVVGGLVGFAALGSFVIGVLKYIGAVDPNTSGKWSAAFQLFALVIVAAWLKLWPSFDIYGADAKLYEFVKVVSLVFAYVTQVTGAKAFHMFALRRVKGFSFNPA